MASADVYDCAKPARQCSISNNMVNTETAMHASTHRASAPKLFAAHLTRPVMSCLCCLCSPTSCLCHTAAAVADAAAPVKGDLMNVSYYPSGADAANVTKRWYIIDAKGQTLGRLATLAATYIRCELKQPVQFEFEVLRQAAPPACRKPYTAGAKWLSACSWELQGGPVHEAATSAATPASNRALLAASPGQHAAGCC
jgi:hypothetical protein